MQKLTMILLPIAALSIGGCEAATEMAGDAIKDQIRTEFISSCEQMAQDNGIAAENVVPACECAADNLAADASDGSIQINQEKIEEILRSCSASDGATDGASADAEAGAQGSF